MKKVYIIIAISTIFLYGFLLINWIFFDNRFSLGKSDIVNLFNFVLIGCFLGLEKLISINKYRILQYILVCLYSVTYLFVVVYIYLYR